jgi:hypothetical protein
MKYNRIVVLLLILMANSAWAQRQMQQGRQSFGSRIVDAAKRTGSGVVIGGAFMTLGLGIDKLNRVQCGSTSICNGNAVQAGSGFAFLGALIGASSPQYNSRCQRSTRGILGLVGAVVGMTAAGAIGDVRLMNARHNEPATIRTMSFALAGPAVGAGIATVIC